MKFGGPKTFLPIFLLGLIPPLLRANNSAGINKDYFGSLCALYSVAQTPEEQIEDPLPAIDQERSELTNDIKKIAILCGIQPSEVDGGVELEKTKSEWINETVGLQGEKTPKFTVQVTEVCGRAPVQKKLLRLLHQATETEAALRLTLKSDEAWKKGVLDDLKWARTATANGVVGKESFTTARTNSCSGDQTGPGKSLINDIACVCGQHSGDAKTCGATITDLTWGNSGLPDNEVAATISVCKPPPKEFRLTNFELQERLENFTRLLGAVEFATGTANHEKRRLHFGATTTSSTGSCAGTTATDQDTCVNYHKVVQEAGGKLTGIKWYERLERVAKKLRQIESLEILLKTYLVKLHSIHAFAWQIYEGDSLGGTTTPILNSDPKAPSTRESFSRTATQNGSDSGEGQKLSSKAWNGRPITFETGVLILNLFQ